jgi:hypothetical protein
MFADDTSQNRSGTRRAGEVELRLSPSMVEVAQACLYRLAEEYDQPVGRRSSGSLNSAGRGHRKHLAKERKPSSTALSFGISMHHMLAEIFNPRCAPTFRPWQSDSNDSQEMAGATLDDYLDAVVERHWCPDGYDCADEEAGAKKKARGLLKYAYAALLPKAEVKVLAVEQQFVCVTRKANYRVELTCKPDILLLHPTGVLEVRDYKTNASGDVLSPRALALDLPTFLYFSVTWHQYAKHPAVRNVVLSQINLHTLRTSLVEYDQVQILANRRALDELVQRIMSTVSPTPTPNSTCAWCAVRGRCPAWSEDDLDAQLELFDEWRNRTLPDQDRATDLQEVQEQRGTGNIEEHDPEEAEAEAHAGAATESNCEGGESHVLQA